MASTGRFQYTPYHPLSRLQLAPALEVINPVWTEVVNGSGTLTGSVAVPFDSQQRKQILAAVEPDESWIVVSTNNGRYPWNGFVVDQEWHSDEGQMHFTAQESRGYLDSVFFRPMLDMTHDIVYTWINTDQLTMAQYMVQYAMLPPGEASYTAGMPTIAYGTETSGKNRDFTAWGLDFRSLEDCLNSISSRDNGFEWTLGIRFTPDNLPILYLELGYPVLGGTVTGQLKRTDQGGNVVKLDPVKRSTKDRRSRQWTTGAGQPPDQPFAQDSDPSLSLSSGPLLREAKTNFNSVIDRSTLASHARSLRNYYSPKATQAVVTVGLDDPDVRNYHAGDRVPFRYKDRVYDFDLPAVRIVQRKVEPTAGKVTLTLDLNDFKLPEVDTGGAV